MLVYGVPGDGGEIVISETNTTWPNATVVTTTATNANPIVAVNIQAPRTNLYVGGLEQAQVFADYAITPDVNVTTSPGINITYRSSAPGVVTVTAGGMVRAVSAGQASVWATIGALSNSVLITVAVNTNTATLIHRYSFSETPDFTTTADSVGGSAWDAGLGGGAALNGNGQMVLDGISGYAQMPAGILNGMDSVTVEAWVTFGSISNWAVLWAFGDTDGTFGHNYITCQPHTGAVPATAQTGIKNALTEQNPFFTPPLDNYTNVHIVAVYHPEAGYCSIYTNGVLAAMDSAISITLLDAMSTGDPYNLIGHSLYSADPYLPVTMDEFLIYQGPKTVGQIEADAALGPNQLIGVSTTVSLSAKRSGKNLLLQWPTSSALVNLMSSPSLGASANWTPVVGPPTTAGGNYQATVTPSGTTQFFRLQ